MDDENSEKYEPKTQTETRRGGGGGGAKTRIGAGEDDGSGGDIIPPFVPPYEYEEPVPEPQRRTLEMIEADCSAVVAQIHEAWAKLPVNTEPGQQVPPNARSTSIQSISTVQSDAEASIFKMSMVGRSVIQAAGNSATYSYPSSLPELFANLNALFVEMQQWSAERPEDVQRIQREINAKLWQRAAP